MKKMTCAMAALMILATACKDKKEQFEINGRIAEADGKTLYFEAVTLNGRLLSDADKEKMFRIVEAAFYEAKAMNKRK